MTIPIGRFKFRYNLEKAEEILLSIGAIVHKGEETQEAILINDENNICRIVKSSNGGLKLIHQARLGRATKIVRRMPIAAHALSLAELFFEKGTTMHKVTKRYIWERSIIILMHLEELGDFIMIIPDDDAEKNALFAAFGVTDADRVKRTLVDLRQEINDDSEEA